MALFCNVSEIAR